MKPALQTLAACAFLAALCFTQRSHFFPPRNDFLQFYVGAKLVGTGAYYSAEANAALQRSLIPDLVNTFTPVHPPFESVLLWPLAWFNLNTAFVLFELVSLAALAIFIITLLPRAPELPLYAALSLPLVFALINGQDVILLLAPLALALRYGDKRPFLSGAVLTLCLIKFHLLLPLPLALMAQRRWRMLAGLASALSLLLAICFALLGPYWPVEYLRFLRDPSISPSQEFMPNLNGLCVDLGLKTYTELLAAAAIMICVWLTCLKSRALEFGLGAAVLAGLLVSHHAYLHDCCLLLLVFAAFRSKISGVAIGLLCCIVLPPIYLALLYDGVRTQANAVLVILMTSLVCTVACWRTEKSPAAHAACVPPLQNV